MNPWNTMEVTSDKNAVDVLFNKLTELIPAFESVEISRISDSEISVDTKGNATSCLAAEHVVVEVSTSFPYLEFDVATTGPVADHHWVHGGNNTDHRVLAVVNGRVISI